MSKTFQMEDVRVVVTPRGGGDHEKGYLVEVPAVQARPGKVILATNVVVERMAWPHEYDLPLLTEVWVS